jgi:enamine deaminase RidA (YjgF/YER057c/UK114 family)/Fe-S cluster biogenesis protein NfuA
MTPTGEALALAVEGKLDTRVRPLLQIHGGEVTLESVDDGHVRVRFEGACVGCPLRPVTLSLTIEREISGVAGVASVSATGVRISPHAAARLRAAFSGTSRPRKLPDPVGNYVGAVTAGNLVFVSGHGPYRDGELEYIGKVPSEVSFEDAVQAAQLVMLNCLADLKIEIGSLDRVKRIVKVLGMVNSDPDFDRQPKVINGASDLLTTIFGDKGRHARAAVGMGALPARISVEIEMVVEID